MKIKEIYDKLSELLSIKEQLKFLRDKMPKNYISFIKSKKNQEKFNFIRRINDAVPLLMDSFYTINTKVYWILNDINEFPKCENDGIEIKDNIKNLSNGYGSIVACCKKCFIKLRTKKVQEINIKKYGSPNPFQFKAKQIHEHHKKKYGNACPANNKEIRRKIEEANLKKFGTKFYSSTKECREKVSSTNMQKYGVTCTLRSAESLKKTKETNLKNWGEENISSSKKFQEHKRQMLIQKYGEDYSKKIWGGNGNIWQNRRAYQFMCSSQNIIPLFTEDEYIEKRKQFGAEAVFPFECKKCHATFESYWDNGHSKQCPQCGLNGGVSQAEKDIFAFLKEVLPSDIEIRNNDRSLIAPLEIDLYIPQKKIAIEYDGLYWHNDDVKQDRNYHLKKQKKCKDKGVDLIHIFENEWIEKQQIVKSRLKNIFGIHDKVVYARKCEVREVDSNASMAFQEENHIQGAVGARVHLGLFDRDELVALMTFGKPRFSKKAEWEMLRFCCKLGYHIPGGAGKLLKQFERKYNPKSMISYADRRWSPSGNLYKALGFSLSHVSNPDYWYFMMPNLHLFSRVQFQKHKLKDILPVFNESLTEVQNMQANGYSRIFDCGNYVFVKVYSQKGNLQT